MSTWMDTPSTSSPENYFSSTSTSPSSPSSPSSPPLRGLASNATVAVAMAMNHSMPAGSSMETSSAATARFNPSMAIIIVVLLATFFFMGILSIYVKKCVTTEGDLEHHHIPMASWTIDHNPRWVPQRSNPSALPSLLQIQQHHIHIQSQLGLDKAAIQALPIVVARPSSSSFILAKNPISSSSSSLALAKSPNHECCVCLGEFQEHELGRLLPHCGHIFHVECIDLWLLAHTTCPLCRFKLTPDNIAIDAPQNPSSPPGSSPSSGIRSIISRVWGFQRREPEIPPAEEPPQRDSRQGEGHEQGDQQQQDHLEITVSSSSSPGEGLDQDRTPPPQECGEEQGHEENRRLAAIFLLKKMWNVFRCWKVGRLIGSARMFGSSSG